MTAHGLCLPSHRCFLLLPSVFATLKIGRLGIKFGLWTSTKNGNKKKEMLENVGESKGSGME